MVNIWITSDTHFGHTKILELSDRPFESVEEMNEILIENWNGCVSPKDTIFHLGDFALTTKEESQKIFNKLNGQKYLILGNHDKRGNKPSKSLPAPWHWVGDVFGLKISPEEFIELNHRPCRSWTKSNYGSGHLYGHSHGKALPFGKSFDVGVDCWDFKPVHLDDIRLLFDKLKDDFKIDSDKFYGPDWLN